MSSENDTQQRIKDFLAVGSDIAGSAAGAALGILISGFPGGLAGSVAAPVAARIINSQAQDFATRMLSRGEQKRVAGVLDMTAAHVEEKMRLGYEPRHDDFFTREPGDRSFAEELAEGVLFAA